MDPTSDDIIALTLQVWEAVLCLPIEPEAPAPAHDALGVTGCVHITGSWEGSVLVQCSRPLARLVTETMFGMDPGEASADEIADALGEIANMIGGNVKSLVPGPSALSLPTVSDGDDLVFPKSEECAYSSFLTENEPMLVSVLRRAGGGTHHTHDPHDTGEDR